MQAQIAGLDVYYEITGRGPWLTLSHSLAAHLGKWEPQVEALSRHFTLLRYDTRGRQATPLAAAAAIASHWPGAKLVLLADAAHLANIEQAAAFNDAVFEFLTAPSAPVA